MSKTANELMYPSIEELLYPFDPYGVNPRNLIVNEYHTVSGSRITGRVNGEDYFVIIPYLAPFHVHDLIVRYKPRLSSEVKELILNKDYSLQLPYTEANRVIGLPFYGGIKLENLDLDGLVLLEYRTMGDDYVLDRNKVITSLAEYTYNEKFTTWDYITDKPCMFNPDEHTHPLKDMTGLGDLIASIDRLTEATAEKGHEVTSAILKRDENIDIEKYNRMALSLENHSFISLLNENIVLKRRMTVMEITIADMKHDIKMLQK